MGTMKWYQVTLEGLVLYTTTVSGSDPAEAQTNAEDEFIQLTHASKFGTILAPRTLEVKEVKLANTG